MKTQLVCLLLGCLILGGCGDQTSSSSTNTPSPDMEMADVAVEDEEIPDEPDAEVPEDVVEEEDVPDDAGDDDVAEDEELPDNPGNQPPTARAGEDFTWHRASGFSLDGSQSTDPEGGELTFSWTLDVEPSGSVVNIIDASTPFPKLNLQRALANTVITATLIVVDDEGASGSDEITITPGSFPSVPAFSIFAPLEDGQALVGDGDKLYAGTRDGLFVFGTDDDVLRPLHSLEFRNGIVAMVLQGDRLVAIDRSDNLMIYDVQGEGPPVETAIMEVNHRNALAVSGDTAYVSDFRMNVVDLQTMEVVQEIEVEEAYGYFEVIGQRLIGLSTEGLDVYDITSPQQPTLVQTIESEGFNCQLSGGGDQIFVGCNGRDERSILYRFVDGSLVEQTEIELNSEIGAADIFADKLWILEGRTGLSFTRLDVENPESPSFLSTGLGLTQCDFMIAIDERRAVCTEDNGNLLTLLIAPDTSSRYQQTPFTAGSISPNSLFEADDNVLYTTTGAGLEMRRADDIGVLLGRWSSGQPPLTNHNAVRSGNRVFFKSANGALVSIDISDPGAPEVVGTFDDQDTRFWTPQAADENRLIMSTGPDGAIVILNPDAFETITTLRGFPTVRSAALDGDRLAVAYGLRPQALSLTELGLNRQTAEFRPGAFDPLTNAHMKFFDDRLLLFIQNATLSFDLSEGRMDLVSRHEHAINTVGNPASLDEVVMAIGGQISLVDFTDHRIPHGLAASLLSSVQHRSIFHQGAFIAYDPNPGAIVRAEIPPGGRVQQLHERGTVREPLTYTVLDIPPGARVTCAVPDQSRCTVEGNTVTWTPTQLGPQEIAIQTGESFWARVVAYDQVVVE